MCTELDYRKSVSANATKVGVHIILTMGIWFMQKEAQRLTLKCIMTLICASWIPPPS